MSVAVPSVAPADATEIVVRPPARWLGFGFGELWRYRELLYFLTKRELQVRYKQSLFGVAWAIVQPLAYAALFTLFARANGDTEQGLPYPVFVLAALVPWIFVAQAVGQSASSLVSDANLLTKVYFPRLLIPLAKVLSFLVDLALALGVLTVFVLLYGVHPSAGLALLPFFLLLAMTTALGVGVLLAALNVKYRDVAVAIPLLVQLWFFATLPVIYLGTTFSGKWQYVYALNPMVTVIQGTRWGFLGTPAPDGLTTAISTATAVTLLFLGVVHFRRTERFFADVV
ncbi:MAG: ABC transporter permease [Gaiellaceae bacterium]